MRHSLHAPLLLSLALGGAPLWPLPASAQAVDTDTSTDAPLVEGLAVAVVIVRDGDAPGIGAADDELVRCLREVGGFSRAAFSAVELAELRLVVGCDDDGAACLDRLAVTLDATALVVRRARIDSRTGDVTVSLVYRDRASSDRPLTATREASSDELAAEMPSLVRSLYGVAPTEATRASRRRPWIWLTLGSGGAVLLGGAILGASASWGEHTTLAANTSADLARIESSYAAAQLRADAGNVLLGVGALIVAVGGTLLLVDLLDRPDEPAADHLDLAFTPSLQGGMLTLRHTSRSLL